MSNSGPAETSLGFIERARAGPLSAKADGKPPALSPVSNRLRAKMTKADLMSRHVPLLRWTRFPLHHQWEVQRVCGRGRAKIGKCHNS